MDASFFHAMMSHDNVVRSQAEKLYTEKLNSNPGETAVQLLGAVASSEDHTVKMLASILLRRVVDGNGKFWPQFDEALKTNLRCGMVAAFEQEQTPIVSRKIAHTIAACAAAGGWVDLVPGVAGIVQQGALPAPKRAGALFLLEQLAEYAEEEMKPHTASLLQVYQAALADPVVSEVRVCALKAIVSLLMILGSDSNRSPFAPLLLPMLEVLSASLMQGEELNGQAVLESFSELARTAPLFFKQCRDEVVQAMMTVASAAQLEFSTRALALEVIITLCEGSPAQMRKSEALVQGIFPLCLSMAMELEEDEATWCQGVYNDMVDMEEDAVIGEEAMERLATALGAKVALPVAMVQVPPLASDAQWQKRRAAASFLCRLADGVTRGLKPHLPGLITLLVPLLSDPHQRVRFQALQCVGRMADVFGGSLQAQHHGALVVPLAELVANPGNSARVRGHACSALINFCHPEKCTEEAVAPYLNTILQALCSALQDTPPQVQEAALTAVACVAQVTEADFTGYYSTFMPGIKQILCGASSPDLAELRGKAMECVGLIGDAVGAEVFQQDAMEILQLLVSWLPNEESPFEYLAPACARICKAIGPESAQYLPILLPPLFTALDAEIKFELEDADEDANTGADSLSRTDGLDSIALNIRGFGNKRVTMNTHAVFEKSSACRIIYEYASNLQEHYLQYVEPSFQRLFPLITFRYSEEVRSAASLALGQLFGCITLSLQRCLPPSSAEHSQAVAMGHLFLENAVNMLMNTGLKEEPRDEARICMAEAMKEILRYCYESGGGLIETGTPNPPQIQLTLEKAHAATQLLVNRATESMDRRKEHEQSFEDGEEYDAEDAELLEEVLQGEEELMGNLVDAIGYILKGHRENFLPIFDELVFKMFGPILAEADKYQPSVLTNAVCAFDDCIEWCGQGAVRYAQECLPFFIACLSQEDTGLQQSSIYGIIQIAKHHPALLQNDCAKIIQTMSSIIDAEDALEEEKLGVTENAVSALGTLAANPSLVGEGASGLFEIWIQKLPLKFDEAEARVVHRQLCDLVESNNQQLLSDDGRNVPFIIKAMVEVIHHSKTDLECPTADQTTVQRMTQILQDIQQKLPQVFQATWDQLPELHKLTVQS